MIRGSHRAPSQRTRRTRASTFAVPRCFAATANVKRHSDDVDIVASGAPIRARSGVSDGATAVTTTSPQASVPDCARTSTSQRTRPGAAARSHTSVACTPGSADGATAGSSARAADGAEPIAIATATTTANCRPDAVGEGIAPVVSEAMRRASIIPAVAPPLLLALFLGLAGCDDPKTKAPDVADAGAFGAARPSAVPDAAPIVDAAAPAPTWDGSMPERPVPKTSPTVGAGMPVETQMQAIRYMAAMGQPRFDDAPIDSDFVHSLATQLKPVAMALDKGSAADKLVLNRVDVVGGGRRIDVLFAAGCDAQMPTRTVGRANVPLATLLSHGVLVVACHDARVQCLQSTRDATDILCTTAPRHK